MSGFDSDGMNSVHGRGGENNEVDSKTALGMFLSIPNSTAV